MKSLKCVFLAKDKAQNGYFEKEVKLKICMLFLKRTKLNMCIFSKRQNSNWILFKKDKSQNVFLEGCFWKRTKPIKRE